MRLEDNLEELDMSCNTLFGKVPKDWSVSTIGDIAELRQGLQISSKKRLNVQEDGSIPLLKITDLPKGIFSEFVKDIPENYIANKDDIIYTRTGQVGLVYTGVEGCVHNNCFKVIVDYNKFNKNYIYYYLKSRQVKEYANIIASGSVQKDLTHKAFKIVKIGYPKLEEQEKIANILSSLDDKIELNNEMNKTLEEMAQAIFKRWFVDFEFPNENGEPYKSSGGEMVESERGMIPKGWVESTLNEIAIITMGVSPKSSSYNVENIGTPLLNGASDFNGTIISPTKYTSEPKKICKVGDMVFCIRATIGNLTFTDREYCIGRGVASVTPKEEQHREFIYFNINESIQTLISQATGSVFLNLTKDNINDIKIVIPIKEILNKFSEVTVNIINKIQLNNIENEKLISLRDTLLPKLMSGEVTVKKIN